MESISGRGLAQPSCGRGGALWSGPRRTSASSCTRTTARSPRRSRIGRAVGEHGISQAVLIARDNDTRAALNTDARDHVHAQGQLGDDVDYGRVTVAVGDRIICRRN
jgi:hypothetical protein